ncbi:Putative GPI transamidase component Gaa1 [Colletotrichum destructivum]|uniref:GPI transamidase component Gaa1 n=1 Tax=Colletotrichum destructivum TaxID=34406 RepID=A0AAX4INP2_9PEZI|nr:Putative GPI transamidase component Gaa1 [Colletotrichum destructivum]
MAPLWAAIQTTTRGGACPFRPTLPKEDNPVFAIAQSCRRTACAMSRLISSALSLRRDPRILKLPPYLSLACILGGIAWLFLLPLNDYSRRTYISENALLPGQVHTYFGGSDQNVLRAYRQEVTSVRDKPNYEINDKLEGILKNVGLKVGRQNYTYESAGDIYTGENIYAILQAPRGDATEAIVLVAAWKTVDDRFNVNGVPLALTLARYFKRWSLWSKDIILLFPPDSRTGTQAWVDAYHDSHDSSRVSSLPLKSGALQGAIAIDFSQEYRFESIHIIYDGINGQLPNLDLINSVVNIAGGQMGMGTAIQEMWSHSDKYQDRLRTMLRGMLNQGLGHASGPHSSFIPYHVDAVTLQPFGEGWHDEMGMGRLVEGTFRSLNNLLEHLHQSFFFYLLMHKERFVSIGTYLPSAMILAASFTITAISLWVKSGQQEEGSGVTSTTTTSKTLIMPSQESAEGAITVSDSPTPSAPAVERDLFLPLGLVAICQFLGVVPLYIFNHMPASMLSGAYTTFALVNCALPFLVSSLLSSTYNPTVQQYQLIKSFSLLLLGMFLSALATLNFSLAFLVGVMASPLSFMRPWPSHPPVRWVCAASLQLASPTAALYSVSSYFNISIGEVLKEAAFGWDVWGMYTPVIIWGVWWPAWLMGSVIVLGQPAAKVKKSV